MVENCLGASAYVHQPLLLEFDMNKQGFSDRSYQYTSGSIITVTAISALLMGATPALTCDNGLNRNMVRTYSSQYFVNTIPPNSSSRFMYVPSGIATASSSPVETVKRYLRFIRQGIWDHSQLATRQGDENLFYAYNMLSPAFKRDVVRTFDEFRKDWLLRCDLQYTEHQIAVFEQVGDIAIVYAPIAMPGCEEIDVRYLKLKLDPQGRSWQIDAACSNPSGDCNVRARRF